MAGASWTNVSRAKPRELADAFRTANAHHLVAALERVLDHVLPNLPEAPTMQTFMRLR